MNRVRSFSSGYTIVEALIFLAVSGAFFLSAMLLVNGQQRRTAFKASVYDFDTKLQSVINNVQNGYYQSDGKVECTLDGLGNPVIGSAVVNRGENSACIYIGQYVHLDSAIPDVFTITSYAGLRRLATGGEPTTIADAKPVPISATSETYDLNGINAEMSTVAYTKIAGSPGETQVKTPIDTIRITNSFASTDGAGNLLSGGSRHALSYTVFNTVTGVDEEVALTNIIAGIQICLSDGEQVGVIYLNNTGTRVEIGTACP